MKKPKLHAVLTTPVLLAILSLALVGTSLFEYFSSDRETLTTPNGSIVVTRTHAEPQDASPVVLDNKSLDLRVVSQRIFDGAPLEKIRQLPPDGGISKQVISFQVGGLKEYALMTLPSSPQPKSGYPVLILCHGYTNPQKYQTDGDNYLPDMEFYTSHGFAVIRPDFRGYGDSQGRPEGAYYSIAYNDDLMTLISSIKKTNYLDKSKINAWGHSMGAYIALRGAVTSPDIKNVILLSGPVGTVYDMYTGYYAPSDRSNPVAKSIREDQLAIHGTPLSNPKFWYYTSPLNYLDRTKANIQINVGSADEVVPPRFSQELSDQLDKLSIKHGYYIYQGGDHGLGAERSLIWSRSLQLLEQNLQL